MNRESLRLLQTESVIIKFMVRLVYCCAVSWIQYICYVDKCCYFNVSLPVKSKTAQLTFVVP